MTAPTPSLPPGPADWPGKQPVRAAWRDGLRVVWLWPQVIWLRLRHCDQMVEQLVGLRRALETQRRAQTHLLDELSERDARIEALRQEYAALESRQTARQAEAVQAARLALLRRLLPVLTQLPTLRAAVETSAGLSAGDVLAVLAPLDELLADLGLEQIGEAGQAMAYDPLVCRVVGAGAGAVRPGDPVRVRYVGYRLGEEVLARAEVVPLKR